MLNRQPASHILQSVPWLASLGGFHWMRADTNTKRVAACPGGVLWQCLQELQRSAETGPGCVSEAAAVASLLSCRFVRLIWIPLEMGQLFALCKVNVPGECMGKMHLESSLNVSEFWQQKLYYCHGLDR